jgi:hypothetical protein
MTPDSAVEALRITGAWGKIMRARSGPDADAQNILIRTRAADSLFDQNDPTPDALDALDYCIHTRIPHKEWIYHGLDGAAALRTLILLKTPRAIDLARFTLWRDDPALDAVNNPEFKVPRSWVDWRMKSLVFEALEHFPGPDSEKLCRDYLALTEEQAKALGPPQFDPASKTLLIISPKTQTAVELIHHPLKEVQGRAILQCLQHASEPWAIQALQQAAPHALAYRVPAPAP